jgi:hypothetical protein
MRWLTAAVAVSLTACQCKWPSTLSSFKTVSQISNTLAASEALNSRSAATRNTTPPSAEKGRSALLIGAEFIDRGQT